MVVSTRVAITESLVLLERREPPPPCAGPSSVRIRCTLTREHSSIKLGGGGRAVVDRRDAGRTGERTFHVHDSSLFLRHEDARRAVHAMLASMPLLRGVDLSPDNWAGSFFPGVAASFMMGRARQDDDEGHGGDRYHFYAEIAMEVRLVYSEPKAVVRACADTVMQTIEPGSAEEHCSICMEGLDGNVAAGAMCPVNLPCSHAFHTRGVTVWLFKGRTCPVCRLDLGSLVYRPGSRNNSSQEEELVVARVISSSFADKITMSWNRVCIYRSELFLIKQPTNIFIAYSR